MDPKGERPPSVPDLIVPAAKPSGAPRAVSAAPKPDPVLPPADDFGDMEIERGGHVMPAISAPPTTSARPRPADPRLELAAPRSNLSRAPAYVPPSAAEKALARAVAVVPFSATFAALRQTVHVRLPPVLPHAFDATSTVESGAVAIGALVAGIAIGVAGLRARPRSITLLGSAAAWLVSALAMVTVALVATEDHPAPADGALLFAYAAPLGMLLFGVGLAGRAAPLWLRGGSRRALALAVSVAGGAIAFVAFAASSFAR